MDTYLGVVYITEADIQLQELIDSDIRYQLEPEEYEWLLRRRAEGLGRAEAVEGESVYIFTTAPKKNGPPRLAISYRILAEERMIEILDIRPLP